MSSWANLLAGKVAVVTGASRGLGRADALALAEAGADVIVTDILIESDEDNEKAAEKYGPIAQVMQSTDVIYTDKTVQEIKAMERRSKAYKMDVTDIRIDADDDNEKAVEKYGPIEQVMQNTEVIYTDKTVQEIKAIGRRSKAYNMDVTDQYQVKEILAQIKDESGKIDILINNAG